MTSHCRKLPPSAISDPEVAEPNFSASQIATALGITPRAVRQRLQHIAPAAYDQGRGGRAPKWTWEQLPGSYRVDLAAAAQRAGCRTPQDFLSAPVACWQPEIPWSELANHCQAKAIKLRRALLPSLERLDHPLMSAAEFELSGVEHYGREFQQRIDSRHFRRLLDRTLHRDAGVKDWDRIELFLPDKLARREHAAAPATVQIDCAPLRTFLLSFTDHAAPTEAEQQLFWVRFLEFHDQRLAASAPPRALQQTLVAWLMAEAKWLNAPTANALRVTFKRKLARWQESGGHAAAVADLRTENSGRHRTPPLTEEDRNAIVMQAMFFCGGRLSQAWRDCCTEKRLSETLLNYYLHNPASKSYVPHFIRDAVKEEIAGLDDLHHGPRQAKLNGPYIRRNWDKVHSGDWWMADDCTAPVYYLEPDGAGWWKLMRGQTIVFIDLRSTRILGLLLHSEKTYNARIIRSLITRTCDMHGLPRKGFYFERGLWKSSRLLTGDAAARADECDWGQSELGLREFGLKFIHAQLPRAKPVERVLGALQDRMEGEPGYVGRNEIVEKLERVQKAKLAIERHDEAALKLFYTADQWFDRLNEIAAHYNAERQDGRLLNGLSPDEAFALLDDHQNPPVEFDARTRHLLAHHRRPVRITPRGFVAFKNRYYGPEIGHLIGREMLAWYNPDTPEHICLTDMERKNPIMLPRANDPHAIEGGDVLVSELQRASGHLEHTRTRYRVLSALARQQRRQVLPSRAVVELGSEINRVQVEAAESQQRLKGTQRKARQLGIAPAAQVDDPERANRGMDLIEQARRRNAKKVSQE